MSETEQASAGHRQSSTPNMASQAAWFWNWLREGADKAMETVIPSCSAAEHFREARLEVLRGIRELVDYRIERLSKTKSSGSRIVVE